MLGNLLGAFVDKEKITFTTIQECLKKISKELECNHDELFIMIKPTDADFKMKFYIYRLPSGKVVREITLKEILNIEEDE
jgi:hypothetical protein